MNLDPNALRIVQEGLFDATHGANGTSASIFGPFAVDIAGKTGTAEKFLSCPATEGRREAPRPVLVVRLRAAPEKPTLAVCALIENGGHGGTAAAPAAHQAVREVLQCPRDTGGPGELRLSAPHKADSIT